MKHLLPALILLATCWSCSKDRTSNQGGTGDTTQLKNYTKDLTIVNWNIEWFGSSRFAGDPGVQESNAGRILRYLDADLYGICEVVDTARFGSMIRRYMGGEFRYVISPYPRIDQKLAIVYNKNIFRNVRARPFMSTSATAAVYFASGRFPFLFTAEAVVNGQRNTVHFILLHAKAGSGRDAYEQRSDGSRELKDSIDTYLPGQNCMVFGDFNDHLNGSIIPGSASPYQNFINDAARYRPVTLPLNAPGYQSTITFPNSVIDQQLISGRMAYWYRSGSAKIRTDVVAVVPDYRSGKTSDHYPVSSVYNIAD
ncbi:exonuclease/endonuclease/phosphatase family protein [Niabella drilacis]|uniref:Endonuclease/Exonuclease/phosphatase family protein n=1 Tax=Niabella drilacis (strain DSM 25811 / CCM 8410 / CCUG 62505 / LMG 26954 / E90) TaxID=1285928 RepID=A0A1G6JR21_NIADE|nr:endonuclease/exonuclease/phosphatase [Niabella drilacis]SDC21212.1 Endonuclease/Exonuclease/phosphatase family protein [Niabella drilacis]